MQKYAWVIGLIWLSGLTLIHFSHSNMSKVEGTPVIAFVIGDSIQQGMFLIDTLQLALQENIETVNTMLQEEAIPLQAEAQELITYANSGNATDNEIEIAQKRVYELEGILNQMQQEAANSIRFQEQTMQVTITTFLTNKLQEYSEANGIDIILNRGLSGEGVLYGSEIFDITADVLEELNASN